MNAPASSESSATSIAMPILDAKQPSSLMPTYARQPIAFVRGQGSWLYTADDTAYLDALTASVKQAYEELPNRPKKLVISYHGVPERYLLAGDPYHCQCQKTTRLLAERLGWEAGEVMTSFQSKFGPEKWVGPATVELVADLAKQGVDDIAVVSPAFAADCIETLEEIQGEIAEAFEAAGGKSFTYIPCLNDRDDHMDALFGIATRELAGWLQC